jgi:3-hydroxyisobutyrate dehydrogenase
MTEARPVVGFIGTGVMGQGMIRNLLKAGFPVQVFNRTKEKAEAVIADGAVWQESIQHLAETSDVVITIVGYPKDVDQVYLEENGIVAHAKEGTLLIDMTTSSPRLAGTIYNEAKKRGLSSLDAPVSGGDVGASNGTLSIMVGGDEAAFNQALPLFEAMGQNIVHQGAAGAGQHTKMSNQITIAGNMLGVSEAIAYAVKAGLDPDRVLKSITSGAAGSWSLNNLAPRMLQGDFNPGFYIKHFIKDMKIALESAEEMGLLTPGLALAKKRYEELAEKGDGDLGTQALYKLYIKQ